MGQIPAFCDNCNNIFPSGFAFENIVIGVTMKGNKSQCPRCGHMARVPDGVFNFYQNGIEVLEASESTIKDLQRFYSIVQNATKREAPVKEVQEEIDKEVPKLSFLAKFLPKNAKELAVYLSAIGALISGFSGGGDIKIDPHIEINRSIEVNQYNVQLNQTNNQLTSAVEVHNPYYSLPTKKIGRNEPCPCNSGKKYKYCHGK